MVKDTPRKRAREGQEQAPAPAPVSPPPAPQKTAPAQPVWPADGVVRLEVTKLIPYARNAMTHTEEQVNQIATNIRRFGWTNPIIVDERGEIIAGHGRILAAQKLGLTQVPGVVIQDGEWSEEDKRAYRIWDNQAPRLADWSAENLRFEVGELKLAGYDMPLLGFPVESLKWMTAGDLIDDATGEWAGMPRFNQDDVSAYKTLHVHFKDQAAVDQFAELIGQPVGEKTRFVWFPIIEIKPFVKYDGEGTAERAAPPAAT